VIPPPGTTSTTETRTVDSNGNEVDSTKTVYGSSPVQPPVETTVTKKVTTISTSN
jgi:hypothetical protein